MTASAGSPAAAVLSFHDLTLGYAGLPALERLNGTVRRGDQLAVVGPNGAGKSTLLRGIVGLADILAGRLDRHGCALPDIAYLPQRAEIDTSFPISVRDFVAMGLWRRIGAWRRIGREDGERLDGALARVGLAGAEARPIGRLSGGQLQRALFARTIVQDAALILLDEPFAAIDEETTADLLAVVAAWCREGRTVLATLHDLGHVRDHFPKTLLLAGEAIACGATASVLTPVNIARSRRHRGSGRSEMSVARSENGAARTAGRVADRSPARP